MYSRALSLTPLNYVLVSGWGLFQRKTSPLPSLPPPTKFADGTAGGIIQDETQCSGGKQLSASLPVGGLVKPILKRLAISRFHPLADATYSIINIADARFSPTWTNGESTLRWNLRDPFRWWKHVHPSVLALCILPLMIPHMSVINQLNISPLHWPRLMNFTHLTRHLSWKTILK